MSSYNVCTQPRCKNPVPVSLESRRCERHGGETVPVWAIYHDKHGWLVDTGVGGSFSFDIDDAEWFIGSTDDVVATLLATDLIEVGAESIRADRWRRVGHFMIMLIK